MLNLALKRVASNCAGSWSEVFDYAGKQKIIDDQYNMVSDRANSAIVSTVELCY